MVTTTSGPHHRGSLRHRVRFIHPTTTAGLVLGQLLSVHSFTGGRADRLRRPRFVVVAAIRPAPPYPLPAYCSPLRWFAPAAGCCCMTSRTARSPPGCARFVLQTATPSPGISVAAMIALFLTTITAWLSFRFFESPSWTLKTLASPRITSDLHKAASHVAFSNTCIDPVQRLKKSGPRSPMTGCSTPSTLDRPRRGDGAQEGFGGRVFDQLSTSSVTPTASRDGEQKTRTSIGLQHSSMASSSERRQQESGGFTIFTDNHELPCKATESSATHNGQQRPAEGKTYLSRPPERPWSDETALRHPMLRTVGSNP